MLHNSANVNTLLFQVSISKESLPLSFFIDLQTNFLLYFIFYSETNLKKNQGFYDDDKLIESAMWYGSVGNNTEGMWRLDLASTSNSFFVHSTSKGETLHPSWLVSDYLVVNKTTPDTGTPIKNIANRLGEYEYTYTEPGTYKAVFVLNNANYKDEDSRIITMLINVK